MHIIYQPGISSWKEIGDVTVKLDKRFMTDEVQVLVDRQIDGQGGVEKRS